MSDVLKLNWSDYKAWCVLRDRELYGCREDSAALKDLVRYWAVTDRYFLMERLLRATSWLSGVSDEKREYVYNFCRGHELESWGYVDLAARYHCKSLVVTYAHTVQELLRNPEWTQCIFSFKGNLAKAFLMQVKTELEVNDELKTYFDDVLYWNPERESPKWSENEGLCVKRKGNPREMSLEAVGLIDGQATGKHFNALRFDDAIEKTCGGSQHYMEKAEEAMRLAIGGLGTHDKVYGAVGTRWKLFDAYENLSKGGLFKIRRTEATSDNTRSGEPKYLTDEEWKQSQLEFTSYQFSCQMLNDPQADSAKNFQMDWLQFYKELGNWRTMNRYILVDPATSKKKDSDFTAMIVMGLARDGNYYVLDVVHDRLSLYERVDKLFKLVSKWEIKGKGKVGYERYGMMADIEAIKARQAIDMDYWEVVELGGKTAKEDRIEKLMPIFQKQKLYLPQKFIYTNWEKENVDIVRYFIDWEYLPFPNGAHDDLLDAMARIVDEKLGAYFPEGTIHKTKEREWYDNFFEEDNPTTWLSM